MKQMHKLLAGALLTAGTLTSATAATAEFGGYFRSGAGSSDKAGKEVCFRLPGSIVWFRLGNECDTYAEIKLGAKLGEVDGTTFRAKFTTAYGTQQLANWEQTSPSFREAYVEAVDIGSGTGIAALKGATLWAGKRFYKNPDVHMLDYAYLEPAQGPGFGLDDIDVGVGKFSYAMFRIGDFNGYGVNTSLGGFNPDIIGGGARATTVHDLRLQNVEVNPGGKMNFYLDIVRPDNRGGVSTYTSAGPNVSIDHDNNPLTPNVLVPTVITNTIQNKPGKSGYGLTVGHQQDNLLGLGGFHNVVFQYAKDAALLKGFGVAGSVDNRTEWMLFDHWVMEPKGMPVTASFTAGLRNAKVNNKTTKDLWVGIRPQYHLTNVWSLMSEVGYQQVKPEGEKTRTLSKVTLGTQFSMGASIWSRPSIRFYSTWAKWNDAAAKAPGGVVCTGRDCNTKVDAYNNNRKGVGYGVQVEAWF